MIYAPLVPFIYCFDFFRNASLSKLLRFLFRYESDVKLLTMMTTYDENIDVLTINHKAAIDYISNKLSETEEELASKLEELEKIKNEKEGIMVDLSFSEQEIAEMRLLRIVDLQNSKLAEENFLHEKKREIESLLEDGQERMQLLIEHNEVNLTTEIGTYFVPFRFGLFHSHILVLNVGM